MHGPINHVASECRVVRSGRMPNPERERKGERRRISLAPGWRLTLYAKRLQNEHIRTAEHEERRTDKAQNHMLADARRKQRDRQIANWGHEGEAQKDPAERKADLLMRGQCVVAHPLASYEITGRPDCEKRPQNRVDI